MPKNKTSLGIDISNQRINMVLLAKSGSGIKVLKTASAPVPENAFKDGNIEEPVILAKAIKKLKKANRISNCHAAVSLVSNPMLIQILDIPKTMPAGVGQFVRSEVKHYASLPLKTSTIDYCKINSSADKRQVLVAASDSRKITDFVNAANRHAGLSVDSVEPAVLSFIRACYEKQIAAKTAKNLLFAVIDSDFAAFCLFRNQTLEFLRVKRPDAEVLRQDRITEWLAGQINEIVRFYESKAADDTCKIDVTVITELLGESASQLRNRLTDVELEIKTPQQACSDTPLADTDSEKPSVIAVGLAMKLLDFSDGGLNINFVPPDIARMQQAKKQAMVIANIAASILLVMLLSLSFLMFKEQTVYNEIKKKRQPPLEQAMAALLNEQLSLNKQIEKITGNLTIINNAVSKEPSLKWAKVLKNISSSVPKKVQLIAITAGSGQTVTIEGKALTHGDIRVFLDMLNASEYIASASLVTAKLQEQPDNLLEYSIACTIKQ